MTIRDRLMKNALFFLALGYYMGGYFFINWWTGSRPEHYHPILPYEADIPFVPTMLFVYLLIYVFISCVYLLIDDLSYFKKVVQAFFILITIHFFIFFIFPVEYVLRPPLDYDAHWLNKVIVFYYWVDLPYNCFPSMHISHSFLVAFILNRFHPGSGRWWIPMAILVAISVVLVKQHYIVDILAGIPIAWLVFRWVFGSKVATVSHSPPLH